MAFFKKNPNTATPSVSLESPRVSLASLNWQRPGGFLLLLLQPLLQKTTSNLRAILWVNGILVLLIAYYLAKLTWLALPAPPQEDAPPPLIQPALQGAVMPNQPNPQATAGNALITPQDIANWHLLGEVNTAVSTSAVENAPPTSLALSLHGIIASRDRKTARAIIADSSGTENFYALDAQVPGGAVLKEIHADRVILLRGGGHETLMLPKDALEGGLEGDGEQFGAPPLPIANPDEAMLDEYRDALQNHPETLADRIQPMPVHEGGKFVGYRFISPRDPTLLSRLGMQPGDVVTAVNGTQLDNPLKGMQVLRGISAEDEIRVDTVRNGTPRSFILRMN